MAAASSINEYVTGLIAGVSDTGLYACWRLVRTLISAGWTVAQSSNGSSYGAADYWSTANGLGNGAWIVLTGPGSRQFCFWRDTAGSYWTGKVVYSKSGGHTFASASATSPGTLPATAQYMRGSAGTFASWFGGGSKSIKYLTVLAQDVSDGSFYVIGSTPATAVGTFYHAFGFFSLQTFDSNDTDPYVLYCCSPTATADATNVNSAQVGGLLGLASQDGGGTSAGFWGWARNANWKPFSPVYENLATTAQDVDPYSAGTPALLMPIGIGKIETSFRERKGYLRYARFAGSTGLVPGDVVSDNTTAFSWVCVGSNGNSTPYVLFWWGSSNGLALEL